MLQKRKRLGFIGGGLNSAVGRTHAVASQLGGTFELVTGVFSRDPAINSLSREYYGVSESPSYSDLEEFLRGEKDNLDAVVVLTPTPSHYEHVSAALEMGFNVICEKALAMNSAESRDLERLARDRDRQLFVTFNYSGYPMVRELRDRISAGELGRIIAVHVEMPQEGFLRQDSTGLLLPPQRWRQIDGDIPTVSLDLGTHTHHLVSFLIDSEPLEVIGLESHHGGVGGVVDYVSCLAKYPDNVDVSMWFGKCLIGYRNGLMIRVFGELGAALWIQSNPEEILLSVADGSRKVLDRASPDSLVADSTRYQRFKAGHPSGFIEAFANLYEDFAEVLGKPASNERFASRFVSGAKHARRGLQMMEAISRSSRSRVWQQVEDNGAL
jgi:predicted dehydrogenase